MNIEELKRKVADAREKSGEQKGLIRSSSTGPVGYGIIEAVIEVLESQQQKIDELNLALKHRP